MESLVKDECLDRVTPLNTLMHRRVAARRQGFHRNIKPFSTTQCCSRRQRRWFLQSPHQRGSSLFHGPRWSYRRRPCICRWRFSIPMEHRSPAATFPSTILLASSLHLIESLLHIVPDFISSLPCLWLLICSSVRSMLLSKSATDPPVVT